ncbi:MAG: exo-alpha-sialidase [Acidobacteria bacterium]|nr:exo-alpha-sialidase [Acidobacteriota bacterium]
MRRSTWTTGALVALILYCPVRTLAQEAGAVPLMVDVYRAGEAGYDTFRIPSVIAAADGTLLAFAEGRRISASDTGDIDLVVKRSRDGGTTWSALAVVGDNGPNTFGNPCPVLDARTGTLVLFATQNLGTDREKDIIAGTSKGGRTVWVLTSTDHGVSWSDPREVTATAKRSDWTWYATGPGIGIQLRDGRLVIPANHAVGGTGVHHSHVITSDDGGGTWRLGGRSDAGTNESQVVELADGRLMLNMRNHPPTSGSNHRMVATSRDGGETWSPARADEALIEPPAQASLLRLPQQGTGAPRLLFSNPASSRRERMTVRVSEDEGQTWPIARIVHEGPAAYSSLVDLQDRGIGLLFERGEKSPYETITFAVFTLPWLTAGRDGPAAR